jgi:hypothetical protein
VCVICACSISNARPKDRPSTAEVIAEFKTVPSDEQFPERLRLAAAFVEHWQIAVLMRLAAARIEKLTKKPKAPSLANIFDDLFEEAAP